MPYGLDGDGQDALNEFGQRLLCMPLIKEPLPEYRHAPMNSVKSRLMRWNGLGGEF